NWLVFDNNEFGIVFGKITKQRFFGLGMYNSDGGGRGIGIKNVGSDESFTYVGAYYFEMRLPEGTYEIDGLGSPAGGLIPKERAFKFVAENNKIKYIGSIVGDRDLLGYLERNNISKANAYSAIVSFQEYGLAKSDSFFGKNYKPSEPFIQFFVIDERDEDIDYFLKEYPQFKDTEIMVDLIK
ncbi:MAG: hypothetical protein ACOZBW_11530, partial [Thermodesulfobacteriota bacterium]